MAIKQDKILIQATLGRSQQSEVSLTISIGKSFIDTHYQATLKELSAEVKIKGFRQGSAPLNLVEDQLGKDFVLRKASQSIVSLAYLEAVKQTNIRPIAEPKLIKAVTPDNADWQLEFKIPVLPPIKLPKDYLYQLAKKVKNNKRIITPDEAKLESGDKTEAKRQEINQKINQVFTALLELAKVEISPTLIANEVNRQLANLYDQLKKLGMSVEDYAKTKGLTVEQIRTNLENQLRQELSIDFILGEIAKQEKITVDKADVDKVLASAKHEHGHERNQQERLYVTSLLQKQKTINWLIKAVDNEKVIATA